jgi:nucleoid-associated protein YgaU
MLAEHARAWFARLDANGNVGKRMDVQFNPGELSMSKAAQFAEIGIPGIDSPILQFVRGETEQISLELLFDSTDRGTGLTAEPVTRKTNKFYALVKMTGEEHAPPRCRFGWGTEFPGLVAVPGAGAAPREQFDCVVESIQQRFTLFSSAGVPLRAVLNVSLREYKPLQRQLEELNLQTADHTRVHTVTRGETLPGIAWRHYENPAQWRAIADANGMRDVRRLRPGSVLRLPPVTV